MILHEPRRGLWRNELCGLPDLELPSSRNIRMLIYNIYGNIYFGPSKLIHNFSHNKCSTSYWELLTVLIVYWYRRVWIWELMFNEQKWEVFATQKIICSLPIYAIVAKGITFKYSYFHRNFCLTLLIFKKNEISLMKININDKLYKNPHQHMKNQLHSEGVNWAAQLERCH